MIENNNEEYDDIENDVEENSDLIELIQFVQEDPLLWNQTHPDFKNRDKKDIKWNFVGSCLTNQLNGDEARKRFYNLRTTFGKLYKKVCDSKPRSGAGRNHELMKPDWPFYKHMLFLRDVIRPRKSKTSGVRKLEENFVQPKIPKRRRTIAKTHTVQSICNSTPLTNSTVQLLKDSVYENENNINTSHLSQSLPSEEPIIFNFTDIKEEVSSQPYHLDENDSWIETTDIESDNVITPTPDKFYNKKKKNEEALMKNIGDMVGVLKSFAGSSTETPIVKSEPSISGHTLSPTAEALLAFVRASLNKVKEENIMNCFQDVLNIFQKYIEN